MGLIVPRFQSSAVARNRLRRRIREIGGASYSSTSPRGTSCRARREAYAAELPRSGRISRLAPGGAGGRVTRGCIASLHRGFSPRGSALPSGDLPAPSAELRFHPSCSQYALEAVTRHGAPGRLAGRAAAGPLP